MLVLNCYNKFQCHGHEFWLTFSLIFTYKVNLHFREMIHVQKAVLVLQFLWKNGLSCLNGYVTLFGKYNRVPFPIPLFSSTVFLGKCTRLHYTLFCKFYETKGLSCLNGYVTLFGKCNQQVTFPITLFSSSAFISRYTMLHLIQLDLTFYKPNINPVSTWEGKKNQSWNDGSLIIAHIWTKKFNRFIPKIWFLGAPPSPSVATGFFVK